MDFKITPSALSKVGETALKTAGARAAMLAAQRASPKLVSAASRIFQAADLLKTIYMPFEDRPNELLGWLTPRQVAAIQKMVREAGPVRKNLFCIRITDEHPPPMEIDGKVASGIGVAGMFDLLAVDVTYGSRSITGDKVQIGSAVMDKVTGTEAVEIQVTTLDDETGTLKRWFERKCEQVANRDGTFNPPGSYVFEMEIAHGMPDARGLPPELPSDKLDKVFTNTYRVRPVSIQCELSRRDQALQELQMTFTQVDTWNQPK